MQPEDENLRQSAQHMMDIDDARDMAKANAKAVLVSACADDLNLLMSAIQHFDAEIVSEAFLVQQLQEQRVQYLMKGPSVEFLYDQPASQRT